MAFMVMSRPPSLRRYLELRTSVPSPQLAGQSPTIVATGTLTYVERKPPAKTSNPFTSPEPVLDASEVMERIDIVRRESLKRIDDDVDVLKSYLKTQGAPKATIESLEGLTVEQHVSWKKAVDRIEKLLEE
jgi:hypothetical protein